MTTPVKGRSLTARPRVVGATPPPQQQPRPQVQTVTPPRISWIKRFFRWQWAFHARHTFTWWLIVIGICLFSVRILVDAIATWGPFRAYFAFFVIFWGSCIGMLPIVAIYRSGQNIIEDIFK
jgi:hypothetical protein